ncbi:RDD family protein [Nostoc ellipsosporum NOK]|nr:RDD family protein [Nostoc ellipsosporum NOK]
MQETTLADDLENFDLHEEATLSERLTSFMLDGTLTYFGINWLLNYLMGVISGTYTWSTLTLSTMGLEITLPVFSYELAISTYFAYYVICEKLFKGSTVGKFIAGTRAIKVNGKDLTFKDVLLRSLCRLIPFEPFSAIFNGFWHDTLSKTRVIRTR